MMNRKKLFLVQDDDRPMYVLAESWQEALEKWQTLILHENEGCGEAGDPTGIQLLAHEDEVIV